MFYIIETDDACFHVHANGSEMLASVYNAGKNESGGLFCLARWRSTQACNRSPSTTASMPRPQTPRQLSCRTVMSRAKSREIRDTNRIYVTHRTSFGRRIYRNRMHGYFFADHELAISQRAIVDSTVKPAWDRL